MSEELNQDKYTIDLMKTLWENTFRGTILTIKISTSQQSGLYSISH